MLNLNLTQIIPPSLKALRFILAKDKAFSTAWRNKILKDCVFCIRKENNGINLKSDRHEYALVMCVSVCYTRETFICSCFILSPQQSFVENVCFWKGKRLKVKRFEMMIMMIMVMRFTNVRRKINKSTDFVLILSTHQKSV